MKINSALLFLTYRCNLRCGFCLSFNRYWAADPSIEIPHATSPTLSMGSSRGVQEMTTEEIIDRVIPQCELNGVRFLALSGGEVLVRQDAQQIFAALGNSKMDWCVDSNLILCTDAVALTIIAADCDTVFFSLDGPKPIHDKLRCSNKSFEKGTKGLQRLRQARGADSRTKIIINCVLQPGNEHVPEQMPDLAANLGADALSFQLLSEHQNADAFDVSAAHDSLQKAKSRGSEIGMPVEIYPLANPSQDDLGDWFRSRSTRFYKGCKYIYENLRIDPQGNVVPCLEHRIGNLVEEDLADIWNGSVYAGFRKSIARNGPLSACLRCCNMTAETGSVETKPA